MAQNIFESPRTAKIKLTSFFHKLRMDVKKDFQNCFVGKYRNERRIWKPGEDLQWTLFKIING